MKNLFLKTAIRWLKKVVRTLYNGNSDIEKSSSSVFSLFSNDSFNIWFSLPSIPYATLRNTSSKVVTDTP